MNAGWTGQAEAYRRSFAGLCAGTFDALLTATEEYGPRLLDVGAGTGEFARRAVEAGRQTTAIDSDLSMTAMAREVASPGATVVCGSLPELPIATDGFDVVVANFVVNHVARPRAAVAELARVTRPEGTVLITSWTNQKTVQARIFEESLTGAGADRPDSVRLPDDQDFERSVAGLSGLAETAGLVITQARELRWVWRVRWADLWIGISSGIAGIGQTYLAQDPERAERFRQALHDRAEEIMIDGQLVLPSVAAFVQATKR